MDIQAEEGQFWNYIVHNLLLEYGFFCILSNKLRYCKGNASKYEHFVKQKWLTRCDIFIV